MKIDILYCDKDIVVVEKPAGVASSEERGASLDMMSLLRNYLHENNIAYEGLHVVHRLDKPVAGVMVYALNKKAAAILSNDISNKTTKKYYKAILTKEPKQLKNEGEEYITLENMLLRHKKTNTSKIVPFDTDQKDAKKAILRYKIENKIEFRSRELYVVDIELLTGRHHQIRVQFAGIEAPLYGDMRYNTSAKENNEREGVALCSYKLIFNHPITGKRMNFEIIPKNSIFNNTY